MGNIRYDVCYLIFVVETDSISLTDERYIKKFLQTHYNEYYNLLIKPMFVYMGSNTKYDSSEVKQNIRLQKENIYDYKNAYVKVIYCFDRDRINKDKGKIDDYINYCDTNGYEFVIFSKNIEDCFKPKRIKNKVETAKNYYSSPISKANLPISIFENSVDICRTQNGVSNLNIVLKPILEKIKKDEKE